MLAMIIFDSEENARAAIGRARIFLNENSDDITLDGVEIRELVASP